MLKNSLTAVLVVVSCMASAGAQAEPIWHCSRAADTISHNSTPGTSDTFQLASTGLSVDAIALSIVDLMDVYSNKPIHVNGRPVTACFMPGQSESSTQALTALGLKSSVMQLQARKSAIVQSNLRLVTDEADMLACISKNYPAVGYLENETENERVVPCF